ncbi:TonB-dependent receptor plug domain-containing protein [Sphingosinicella xenopeptidilytica]|uniref:TonB-dependent receptor plug domain-containing protein n=1 Tax=Sphingosinicella xenopeptidilytica TaxID=364098 RepID=A0ABW3C7Q1_SPHXN
MIAVFLLSAAAIVDDGTLVVSAAREPVAYSETGGALTVIDGATIEAVALPQLVDLLRLSPGVSVARSGPTGAQTQVRIRGAEANHTLVFVDGIAANDPATSGEFRWETLPSDGIARAEVLRGPQSALWGSEAIGGVVSVTTAESTDGTRIFGSAEAGSFGTVHAAGGAGVGSDKGGIIVQSSWYDTKGIDSFGGGIKERDGYESLMLSAKASVRPIENGELGLVVRHTNSLSEFDGYNSFYMRDDTLDATRIRSTALRGFGRVETLDGRWRHELFGSYVTTDNINRDGDTFLNRTDAEVFETGYQTGIDFGSEAFRHRVTGAIEYRTQRFVADDAEYFGGTNQRVSRDRTSFVLDYGLSAGGLALGASVRRDENDAFKDATTWRASGRYTLENGFTVHASAGKGVTDPTFTEMFGFFPGSFVGNPSLTPERSIGWDVGAGYRTGAFSADVTWFQADLENEIIGTYDSATFMSGVANATGKSKRKGIEASFDAKPLGWLTLGGSYTWLDTKEAQVAGTARVREARRPRHSGSLLATADFDVASVTFAANYVGNRRDTDFDSFPARIVTLKDYVLATLSGRVKLGGDFELTGRIENLFDATYEDAYGYQTQGISAFGGIRVKWGG